MARCLLALAAVAPSAIATQINSRIFEVESEVQEQRMEFSVQARQYAMLLSHEERMEESGPKPSNLIAHESARRLGESASLSEAGYSAVAGLRSQEAMTAFAERILAEDELRVTDQRMLQRVMPFYSGECAQQSLKALRRELHEATAPHGCHQAWVQKATYSTRKKLSLMEAKPHSVAQPQHGVDAPLNETGYQAVAALTNDDEMKKFIRRVSQENGLEVMNEGGLSGFTRYYSGVCAAQSYAALVKELKAVQHSLRATSVSFDLPDAVAVDEQKLKKSIAAAMGLQADKIELTVGSSSLPNATQLKKTFAAKTGVEEDRVTVLKPALHKLVAKEPSMENIKKVQSESHSSKSDTASAKETKKGTSIVITVTSAMDDASVEEALKNLPSKMANQFKMNRAPETVVTSVAQSTRCGGGWVAPDVSL